MGADTLEARVLALLGDGVPRSTGELAEALGADTSGVRECLSRLRQAKRIVRVGTRREPAGAGHWFPERAVSHAVWALAEA